MEENKDSVFSKFIQNVETQISKLTTLEIKTIVGDYEIDENEVVTPKVAGDFSVMESKIDLIQGDMVTHISEEFMQDKYAWLRDFHAKKEDKGHDIIHGNIKAMAELYELYRRTKSVKFNEENMDETETDEL